MVENKILYSFIFLLGKKNVITMIKIPVESHPLRFMNSQTIGQSKWIFLGGSNTENNDLQSFMKSIKI